MASNMCAYSPVEDVSSVGMTDHRPCILYPAATCLQMRLRKGSLDGVKRVQWDMVPIVRSCLGFLLGPNAQFLSIPFLHHI